MTQSEKERVRMKRLMAMVLIFACLFSLLNMFQPAVAEVETKILEGIPDFKQYDPQWSSTRIGTRTIGNVGCLLTVIAMTESYRQGEIITPDKMREQLTFSNDDMFFPADNVCIDSKINLPLIYETINQGKPVIVGAKNDEGKWHWVLITGYVELDMTYLRRSNFQIHDPNSKERTNLALFLADYSNSITLRTYEGAARNIAASSGDSVQQVNPGKKTVLSLLDGKTCRGFLLASGTEKVYSSDSLTAYDGLFCDAKTPVSVVKASGDALLIEYATASGVQQGWIAAEKVFLDLSYEVWGMTSSCDVLLTNKPGGYRVGKVHPGAMIYVLGEKEGCYQVLCAGENEWTFGFMRKK